MLPVGYGNHSTEKSTLNKCQAILVVLVEGSHLS